MSLTIRVHVETLAELFGLWCETCLLPSLVSQTVMVHLGSIPSGPHIIEECRQCGYYHSSLPVLEDR